MKESLKYWLKTLKSAEIKQLTALFVRELDEEEKDCYVAFVDEGEESHDVQVQLVNGAVFSSTCDCKEDVIYCLHQKTVWYQLANKNQPTKPVKKTIKSKRPITKTSISKSLLDSLSKAELTTWMEEVFKKNKNIEQQFIITFSEGQKEYTREEVKKLMIETFTAFAGKRKTLEGVKIKKILDTLAIAFQPINDFVTVHIHQPIAYEIYAETITSMLAFDNGIIHHSKRFNDFYESYTSWFALTINNIQERKIWEEKITLLLQQIFDKEFVSRALNCTIVKQIYYSGSVTQQEFFAAALREAILKSTVIRYYFREEWMSFIKEVALHYDFYDDLAPFLNSNLRDSYVSMWDG